MQYSKAFILTIIAAVLVFTGVGCKGGDRAAQDKAKSLTLSYWTVAADEAAVRQLVAAYRRDHPNVSFQITVVPEDEYEQRLLEAWAEDAGPDIFSIKNTWTRKYQSKITPMPASTNVPFQIVTGVVKKEAQWVLRTRQTYTAQTYANTFVPQVARDAILGGEIYGVPLSFDSLVMYVNRDVLNNANIIAVPETWLPLTEAVKAITLRDVDNNIVQSGIAMGRADNVLYAGDILSLLMMQNGAKMTQTGGRNVAFQSEVSDGQGTVSQPAAQAARFYTDFATLGREVYTWSEELPSSRIAFMNGQTAMFFGYAYDRGIIEKNAPGLNFEIAPFPQIDGTQVKMNFTRYWLETVSNKSKNAEWAWDFLVFATSQTRAEQYAKASNLPTAHRALLAPQAQTNPSVAVFNQQALTAESWYQGKQPEVAQIIFTDIIKQINAGERSNIVQLLRNAAAKINQTL